MKLIRRPYIAMLLLIALVAGVIPDRRVTARNEQRPLEESSTDHPLIEFEENLGQYDQRVRFVAETPSYTLFLTDTEAVYVYPLSRERGMKPSHSLDFDPLNQESGKFARKAFVLRMKFTKTAVAFHGDRPTKHIKNYFRGADPSRWQGGVQSFERVRQLTESGTQLIWRGQPDGTARLDLGVGPEGNANDIAFEFEGADSVESNAAGDLVINTSVGTFTHAAPAIYDEVNASAGEDVTSFSAKDDPATLKRAESEIGVQRGESSVQELSAVGWSTYLGAKLNDYGAAIAVDGSGNVYVTGYSESPYFPSTSGVIDTTLGGTGDVIVAKIQSSGSGLLYSTYIGGDAWETGRGISVDASGNAYITGYTKATTGVPFPTTTGAYDTTHNGSSDAFVVKLNATGTGLLYSTLIGGSSTDEPDGIAIDTSGNAYITGTTSDGTTDYPTTLGAFDRTHNGLYDVFVTKVTPTGSSLRYSTFLGSNQYEYGNGIAIDGSGNAYVTGETQGGTTARFPTTSGAYDTTFNGDYDAFVTKLDATGSSLVYSTALGGSAGDYGYSIAVDGDLEAYITGRTSQTGSVSYPTTLLSYQPFSNDNGTDAFVTKINRLGSGLVFSTFLSGLSSDEGMGIAVDAAESVYVTGCTYDDVTDFPVTAGAFDTTHNGAFDVFVTKLRPAGNGLLYSTFIGGSNWDISNGIAIDASGNAYVTGYTEEGSPDYPVTSGAYDRAQNGGIDIFVTKILN